MIAAMLLLCCQAGPWDWVFEPPGPPPVQVAEPSPWRAAQLRAQREGKPLVLVVSIPADESWCAPCVLCRTELARWPHRGKVVVHKTTADDPEIQRMLHGTSIPQVMWFPDVTKPGTRLTYRNDAGQLVPGYRSGGWDEIGRKLGLAEAPETAAAATMSHMELMRQRYGWIPSQHCGNSRCGMCNDIFGGPPARRGRFRTSHWTPLEAVEQALDLAAPRPGETLVDIGCGDGRVLLAAADRGLRAVGIERDPESAALARWHTADEPLCSVIEADATETEIRGDIVYLYLWPELMGRLDLPGMARVVVSYIHPPPQLQCSRHGDFYVWRRDA